MTKKLENDRKKSHFQYFPLRYLIKILDLFLLI